MSKSIKSALLSALVFPGVGHFYLRKPVAGTVLAGAALASLYVVVSGTLERALQISDKIQRGEVGLDVTAITELVSRQPAGAETQLAGIAAVVFLVVWLLGIADAYRIGRGQDKQRAIN